MMKRGQAKLTYLDVPRIRLLLPTSAETHGFSGVQAGRFSLLGKETRWVKATHRGRLPLFERASILQHILLPRERATQCPFTPVEVGGDGSYVSDAGLLERIIEAKSQNVQETYIRLGDILHGREAHRLVQSETHDQVCTKYGLWLPTGKALKQYLEPHGVVIQLDESNSSLRTLQVKGFLEAPQRTYFRMVKSAYFKACLAGVRYEDLPKYETIAVPRALSVGGREPRYINLELFLTHWVNPGFAWQNQDDYLVRADKAVLLDQMNLGFTFNLRRTLREDIKLWLSSNSIVDLHGETAFDCIANKVGLPRVIRDRLHLMVESDSIIKEEFLRDLPENRTTLFLISRDQALGAELVRLAMSRNLEIKVICVRPAFYLVGRLDGIPEFDSGLTKVIEDPGAILFDDITVFCEGACPDWVYDDELTVEESRRYKNVFVVDRATPRRSDNELLSNSYKIMDP